MNKIMLQSVICCALLASGLSQAATEEKWTLERAQASHRANVDPYYNQAVTPEQSQLAWARYPQEPESNDSGSSGQLEEVWTGNSLKVTNRWGVGAFVVQNAEGHIVTVPITNTTAKEYSYQVDSYLYNDNEGHPVTVSTYIGYENGQFVTYKRENQHRKRYQNIKNIFKH